MTTIKTTHVGSLPRRQEVVDFIFAREQEKQYDQAAFDTCMKSAVSETCLLYTSPSPRDRG